MAFRIKRAGKVFRHELFFFFLHRPDLAVLRPCLSQGPLRRGFCAPLFFVAP
jgi:hypothetical protein